jgi:hypothetical protein
MSNPSLFNYMSQLDELVEKATDEDGVIDFEKYKEEFDSLEMDINDKIDNCLAYYKSRKAIANALKEEKKAIDARYKSACSDMERMKDYLAYCLDGRPHESTAGKISYRKSEVVEITNEGLIPSDMLRYKDPEPDKTMIKKALKNGNTIPGAHLEERINTIIK